MRCLKLADLSELLPGIRVGEQAFEPCGAQRNAMREEKRLRCLRWVRVARGPFLKESAKAAPRLLQFARGGRISQGEKKTRDQAAAAGCEQQEGAG